jgi:GrpB-like predicted nucleotidyltransferase (UPF0157 family)
MPEVDLQPHQAQWTRDYTAVAGELRLAFADAHIVIEHIGSTAVPGLSAKPVIDVLLGASSLPVIEARIDALAALGYQYVARHEAVIPLRRYFVKAAVPRVHVHGVVIDGQLWREHLTFREALRGNQALCAAYQDLKRALAIQHADDKAAYTEAKAPFIQAVLRAAGLR